MRGTRKATIQPECRYCGTHVTYFGDLCADCEPADGSLMEIVNADLTRLAERGDDQ